MSQAGFRQAHTQTETGSGFSTTDVVIEEQEFAESKKAVRTGQNAGYTDAGDGFMNIPDGVDEQLPFCVNGEE